jgi:hypothetical protein
MLLSNRLERFSAIDHTPEFHGTFVLV